MNKNSPRQVKETGAGKAAPAMSEEKRGAILEKLSQAIAAKRTEAINGRKNSGIERFWTEDEEHYQGYDAANRHEFVTEKTKPNEAGTATPTVKHKGSTLFPNITGPYVDAAAAKVSDMLLPTDDRNFVVEPLPVPDILDEEEGWPAVNPPTQPGVMGATAPVPGAPAGMPPAPVPQALAAMAAPQGNPAQQIMADPAAAASDDPLEAIFAKLKAIRDKAAASAKLLQNKIDGYLTQCHYHTQLREVIDDSARIGSGVVKGPVPKRSKVQVYAKNPATGEREMVVKVKTVPQSERVNPWNFFPDPACGQDIHEGSYTFERDFFTEKKLRQLQRGEGPAKYIDHQIDEAIKEGPDKSGVSAPRGFQQNEELGTLKVYEVWYYYGTINGEELIAAGCECDDEDKTYDVLVTMINDRVIKAALNPLDSGDFPYDLLAWKKRPDMPWGVGVSRQGRTAQRITTAALRNLMDNAGASAKPHKVVSDAIEQDGDPWTWRMDSEATDARTAMMFFVQPSLQSELMNIIQMGEKMMELHTGLPMIILGMQGNVEETAHGRALQNNNGSTVLRRIARNFDGYITEPHIRRYQSWEQMYGTDDALKANFEIKARGSAALVERDLQNQQLPTIIQMSMNPALGWDPQLAGDEYLKSQRFDPKAFKLTDKRKAELASQQKPPMVPAIEAAKIKEAGANTRKQMDLQNDQADRQHESHENDLDRAIEKMGHIIDGELGAASLSMEERAALNDAKVTMAGLAIKIRAQKQLSPNGGGQVLQPPTEPAGVAQPGHAFAE